MQVANYNKSGLVPLKLTADNCCYYQQTDLKLSKSWIARDLIANRFKSNADKVGRDPEDNIVPHAVPQTDVREAHQ